MVSKLGVGGHARGRAWPKEAREPLPQGPAGQVRHPIGGGKLRRCLGAGRVRMRCPDVDQRSSIWDAHEPAHAALDGQTLSRNRPRRQPGNVCLRRKHTQESSETPTDCSIHL